ncbi:MAG TPA: hypothetical protein VJ246_04160 [Patescibacteria group bacterium]|nr:hypothetical protein [Patescibacteria group bacterium]
MFPQVLLICQNSRTRRLYHRVVEELQCETVIAKSVADSLVQLVVSKPSVVVLEESLPVFDVSMFLDVTKNNQQWMSLPLVVIGFANQRHLFPSRTLFCGNEQEFERSLKEICATL